MSRPVARAALSRRSGVTVALIVALAIVVVVLTVGGGPSDPPRSDTTPTPNPTPTDTGAPAVTVATRGPGAEQREAAGRRLVAAMQRGSHARSSRAFATTVTGSPVGLSMARQLWHAWRDLHVRDLRLRWVRGVRPPSAAPAGSTAGEVAATWSQPGWSAPVSTQLTVVFSVDGGRTGPTGRLLALATARGSAAPPQPAWAMGRLDVTTTPSAWIVWLPGQAGLDLRTSAVLPALVQRAHRQVSRLLPAPSGRSLVVVPARPAQYRALLGGGAADAHLFAAAATTVGAEVRTDAALQVVFNPQVTGRLRPAAVPVLLAHEITHVFTGISPVPLPLWMAEGFAELVALGSERFPVRDVAGHALAEVRRAGPPRSLPRDSDFAAGPGRTQSAYELAWLAFRTIEKRAGTAATVAFYRAVAQGEPLGSALREQTGLSRSRLVIAWRADLVGLARAAR